MAEESPFPMTSNASNNTNNNQSNTAQSNYDASSPYALHSSDNLGTTTLVTCLLSEENYPIRRWAMTNALQAKSKFGFVDGSIKCPSPGSLEESA